jgi:hypothetical protein
MYKGTVLLEITIHQQHKENNGEVHNIKIKSFLWITESKHMHILLFGGDYTNLHILFTIKLYRVAFKKNLKNTLEASLSSLGTHSLVMFSSITVMCMR